MAIDSKNLLVAVKAFAPANPLPLDSRSLWGSQGEAETYAKQPNAYAGQIITAKVNGKCKRSCTTRRKRKLYSRSSWS